ncbi:MAG: hypothetical protein F6K09_20465, partial [Merismopedia sp. SIO2A8]|nr:hypothetical protein [Merismopedia sp. SIO2A8]
MSGSSKFSEAEIAAWKQKILDAQRKRQAEIERQRREAAEAAERQRQLDEFRHHIHLRIQSLLVDLRCQWSNLYSQDAAALHYRCQRQQDALAQASSMTQLHPLSEELLRLEKSLQESLFRKRRDDAEKRRQVAIEQQQFELEELEQRIAQITDGQAIAFDAAGQQQVRSILQTVREAIAQGNPVAVKRPLAQATALVQKHIRQVTQKNRDWQHLQSDAKQQLSDLQIMVAGLKADPAVMRWQAVAVQALATQMTMLQQAVQEGQVQAVIAALTNLSQRHQTILDIAQAAERQAQRRDYIVDSIGQALQGMGFTITFRQPEHPDHPASAIILGATTQTGKGVSVSVPVEGQVFYDVDGYEKRSATTVEGSPAAICDEAEQMLTDMHATLEDKFGRRLGSAVVAVGLDVVASGHETAIGERRGEHLGVPGAAAARPHFDHRHLRRDAEEVQRLDGMA